MAKIDTKQNLNTPEILTMMHRKGYTKIESAMILEDLIDILSEALEKGYKINLKGFGSFYVRKKRERTGTHPKDPSKRVITPAQNTVIFENFDRLKARVNHPPA